MLSRETMGAACLAVLWVVAILVALGTCQEIGDLLKLKGRLRRLAPGETGRGMIEGVVGQGAGEGGALATHVVDQVGRAIDGDAAALKFHDRAHTSVVHGGVVESGDRRVRLLGESRRASVWTLSRAKESAAKIPDEAAFQAAYEASRTARGYVRTVTTSLGEGDRVFVAGEIAREGDDLVMRAGAEGDLLVVSAQDPRRFVMERASLAAAFVVLELAASTLVTYVATYPPLFGRTGILGALGGLAFFLGVTPVGVAVREGCRQPCDARLRVVWHGAARGARTDEQA